MRKIWNDYGIFKPLMELPTNYVLHLILIDDVNKIWIDEDVQKPHSTSGELLVTLMLLLSDDIHITCNELQHQPPFSWFQSKVEMAWYTYLLRLILCRLNTQNVNLLVNGNWCSMFWIPSGCLKQKTLSSFTYIHTRIIKCLVFLVIFIGKHNFSHIVICNINSTH
jgi:hypothetical protein